MLISGIDSRRVRCQNRNDGTQVAVSGCGVKLIVTAGGSASALSLRPSHFTVAPESENEGDASWERRKPIGPSRPKLYGLFEIGLIVNGHYPWALIISVWTRKPIFRILLYNFDNKWLKIPLENNGKINF